MIFIIVILTAVFLIFGALFIYFGIDDGTPHLVVLGVVLLATPFIMLLPSDSEDTKEIADTSLQEAVYEYCPYCGKELK